MHEEQKEHKTGPSFMIQLIEEIIISAMHV